MTTLPYEPPLSPQAFFAPRRLAGGRPAPRLGLGTAGLAGVWGAVDRADSVRVLLDAWNDGFLLTDTAPAYGHAEEVVSEALAKAPDPELPILCTKLEGYPDYTPPAFAKDWTASCLKQLDRSAKLFGGRVIDGLAMHDPNAAPPEFQEPCARFIADAIQSGRIRFGGIGGGGPVHHLKWLPDPAIRYVITFKRIAALTLQGLRDTAPAARKNNASVVVASPVFMGLLGSMYETFQKQPSRGIDPVYVHRAVKIKALADQAGLPLAQLAIRFVLSNPSVDFMLAGAINPTEWRDTLTAYRAGPLPADLYKNIWQTADDPNDPASGG